MSAAPIIFWWLNRTAWNATRWPNRLLLRWLGRSYRCTPSAWHWKVERVPADLWIGMFHRTTHHPNTIRHDIWICLVPCFPLHISRFVWLRKSESTIRWKAR